MPTQPFPGDLPSSAHEPPLPRAPSLSTFLPWVLLSIALIGGLGLAKALLTARAESILLRQELALTEVTLQSTRNQLEAERILSARELSDARQSPLPDNSAR